MIVSEIRRGQMGRGRIVICFDGDRQDICLYPVEFKKLGISEGDDLPDDEYDRIVSSVLIPRARRRALHLLEKQDRTRADLAGKLRMGGYPDEVIQDAVEYVASYNYIDDVRYARSYIDYHQDVRSRRRLTSDLLKKGISAEIIEQVMEESFNASEEEQIRRLVEKKHYDRESADEKQRASMYRFLASRGYRSSDISRYV